MIYSWNNLIIFLKETQVSSQMNFQGLRPSGIRWIPRWLIKGSLDINSSHTPGTVGNLESHLKWAWPDHVSLNRIGDTLHTQGRVMIISNFQWGLEIIIPRDLIWARPPAIFDGSLPRYWEFMFLFWSICNGRPYLKYCLFYDKDLYIV